MLTNPEAAQKNEREYTMNHSVILPASSISVAWIAFTQSLAITLESLNEGQFLIISDKESTKYVQFAALGESGFLFETSSNAYYPKDNQLSE